MKKITEYLSKMPWAHCDPVDPTCVYWSWSVFIESWESYKSSNNRKAIWGNSTLEVLLGRDEDEVTFTVTWIDIVNNYGGKHIVHMKNEDIPKMKKYIANANKDYHDKII